MKKMIYGCLLAVLLAPAITAAKPQGQLVQAIEKSDKPAAKISAAEATKIALERFPGEATEVTIERKRGRDVYVIEVQSPKEGEIDVFVDIKTGEIVGTER